MNRRLYRCRDNRVLAGVASGVAEFFGLDATLVRVIWFLSTFFGGVTLAVYIGLALIVPLEPAGAAASPDAGVAETAAPGHQHASGSGRWATYFGIALVLLGSLALVGALLPGIAAARYLGPLFIIGMGGVLVVGALRRDETAPATFSRGPTPSSSTPPQGPTDS